MYKDIKINNIIDDSLFNETVCTHENDIVYVGGSRVEGSINIFAKGMGNKYSDIDVFIIREKDMFESTQGEYKSNGKITYFAKIQNEGLDIEVINIEVIKQIVEEIKNTNINLDERIINSLSFPQDWDIFAVNGLLTRYKYSITVNNKEKKEKLINKEVYDRFSHIYKYILLNKIDNLLEDVRGNLDSKEYETALLIVRQLCVYIMSFCLYVNNEFIDREKWVWLKFKNFVCTTKKYTKLFEAIKELLFSELSYDAIESTIDEFLYTAENIIEKEMTGGLAL